MSHQWLRLWHDMPTDPKWRTISKISKQPITSVISVYLLMLVNASNANERGRTHNLFAENIASALDLEIDQVTDILSAMEGRVIVAGKLNGWESRQPIREDNSSERSRAWREKKKLEKVAGENERTQTNANERKKTQDKDKEYIEKILKESDSSPEEVVNLWNEMIHSGKGKQIALTAKRTKLINANAKIVPMIEDWKLLFQQIIDSDWLSARLPGKTWKADIDWVLKPDNLIKIMEGNYANRQQNLVTFAKPFKNHPSTNDPEYLNRIREQENDY